MFNREKEEPAEPQEEFRLPPMATVTVTTGYDKANGLPVTEVWEGHQIEQTSYGGLNIHRIFQVDESKFLQKMIVGYAPGEWRKVTQRLDIIDAVPSKIIH